MSVSERRFNLLRLLAENPLLLESEARQELGLPPEDRPVPRTGLHNFVTPGSQPLHPGGGGSTAAGVVFPPSAA